MKHISYIALLIICPLAAGCWSEPENGVVVYAALDKEFSEPILNEYAKASGVTVIPKFDVESNKTAGLTSAIIDERNRPRCDVFWNNEIMHTMRLKNAGLLEQYRSPLADQYPTLFVSQEGYWHGFAARARVLIVNTDLLQNEQDRPTSVMDLVDPKWKDKCGMARPLFGTTATHAAALFAAWGHDKAGDFFEKVAANARVEGGNKQVALKVAAGQLAWGITDTDDAIIEIERGGPVAIVFPDQGPDGMGTLFIPNTLCIIKNGPNKENAKKLVDHLLQAKIEEKLAKCPSAQIPLNKNSKVKSRVEPETGIKKMDVDLEAAATAWEFAARFLDKTFPVGGK